MHETSKNANAVWNPAADAFFRYKLLPALAVLALLFLAAVAIRLEVDYSDSFEAFWNARSLLHLDGEFYQMKRSALYVLTLVPFFAVESWMPGQFAFRASHLTAVGFFGLFLWASYRLCRIHLNRTESALAVFLLLFNPVLIHLAPFAKEDIPGAVCVTAGFFAYWRARRKGTWRRWLTAGLLLAVSVEMRRAMIPVVFLSLAVYELWTESFRKEMGRKILCLFVLPSAVFFFAPALMLPVVKMGSLAEAPRTFISGFLAHYRNFSKVRDPAYLCAAFLVRSITWPVFLCMAAGCLEGCRKRAPDAGFHMLWAGLYLLFFSFVISHKEPRYLIPVLPSVYFLAVTGLCRFLDFVRERLPLKLSADWRAAAAAGLVLLFPVVSGFSEYAKFMDPFYSQDTPRRIAEQAQALAGDHDIAWAGPLYARHPRDYVFHPADSFGYVYHLYHHVLGFFLKRKVRLIDNVEFYRKPEGQEAVFIGPQIAHVRRDGDVLVVNSEPVMYETKSMPEERKPLVLEKMNFLTFEGRPDYENNTLVFETPGVPGAAIRAETTGHGFLVQGRGIPDGHYELYLELIGFAKPLSFDFIQVRGGKFEAFKKEVDSLPVRRILLLYYDPVETAS